MLNMKPLPKPKSLAPNFPASQPAQGPSKAVKGAPGWQHSGGGNFSHPEHGIVSVVKQGPNSMLSTKALSQALAVKRVCLVHLMKPVPMLANTCEAWAKVRLMAPAMHNRPSPTMDKSITGRMGMGGMNLPAESTDKKNKRGLFNPDVDKIQRQWSYDGWRNG